MRGVIARVLCTGLTAGLLLWGCGGVEEEETGQESRTIQGSSQGGSSQGGSSQGGSSQQSSVSGSQQPADSGCACDPGFERCSCQEAAQSAPQGGNSGGQQSGGQSQGGAQGGSSGGQSGSQGGQSQSTGSDNGCCCCPIVP